jgi:hypothetical protein
MRAACPGRHELVDTDEINWRAVCHPVVNTGFTAYPARVRADVRPADVGARADWLSDMYYRLALAVFPGDS